MCGGCNTRRTGRYTGGVAGLGAGVVLARSAAAVIVAVLILIVFICLTPDLGLFDDFCCGVYLFLESSRDPAVLVQYPIANG